MEEDGGKRRKRMSGGDTVKEEKRVVRRGKLWQPLISFHSFIYISHFTFHISHFTFHTIRPTSYSSTTDSTPQPPTEVLPL